jgi:anti-sigma B factor antagonist
VIRDEPTPLFSIEVVDSGPAIELKLKGDCDLSTADELLEALMQAIGGGRPVIVDLSGLDFLDSSCLRSLLQAYEKSGGDGGLTLRRGSENVMRVFEVTGLLDAFPFEEA